MNEDKVKRMEDTLQKIFNEDSWEKHNQTMYQAFNKSKEMRRKSLERASSKIYN